MCPPSPYLFLSRCHILVHYKYPQQSGIRKLSKDTYRWRSPWESQYRVHIRIYHVNIRVIYVYLWIIHTHTHTTICVFARVCQNIPINKLIDDRKNMKQKNGGGWEAGKWRRRKKKTIKAIAHRNVLRDCVCVRVFVCKEIFSVPLRGISRAPKIKHFFLLNSAKKNNKNEKCSNARSNNNPSMRQHDRKTFINLRE